MNRSEREAIWKQRQATRARRKAVEDAKALFRKHSEWSRVFAEIHDRKEAVRRIHNDGKLKERFSDTWLAEIVEVLDVYGRAYIQLVSDRQHKEAFTHIIWDIYRDLWRAFSQVPVEVIPPTSPFDTPLPQQVQRDKLSNRARYWEVEGHRHLASLQVTSPAIIERPADVGCKGVDYPLEFDSVARAKMVAARVEATREMYGAWPSVQSDVLIAGTQYTLGTGRVFEYIMRIFSAFANEACVLGRAGTWTTDRTDREAREFLRLLTVEAEKKYSGRADLRLPEMTEHGSITLPIMDQFETYPPWQRFQNDLLQLAKIQAQGHDLGVVLAKATQQVLADRQDRATETPPDIPIEAPKPDEVSATAEAHLKTVSSEVPVVKPKPSRKRIGHFPNRAAWLRQRLTERGWDHNRLPRHGGPHRKTVLKILAGGEVNPDVLEKLAKSLSFSTKVPKVTVLDIPTT